VDLLGYLREESGDPKAARGAGADGTERRNAPAVLLAWLSSPMKQEKHSFVPRLFSLLLGNGFCFFNT
jgi:hypothetical protein